MRNLRETQLSTAHDWAGRTPECRPGAAGVQGTQAYSVLNERAPAALPVCGFCCSPAPRECGAWLSGGLTVVLGIDGRGVWRCACEEVRCAAAPELARCQGDGGSVGACDLDGD